MSCVRRTFHSVRVTGRRWARRRRAMLRPQVPSRCCHRRLESRAVIRFECRTCSVCCCRATCHSFVSRSAPWRQHQRSQRAAWRWCFSASMRDQCGYRSCRMSRCLPLTRLSGHGFVGPAFRPPCGHSRGRDPLYMRLALCEPVHRMTATSALEAQGSSSRGRTRVA